VRPAIGSLAFPRDPLGALLLVARRAPDDFAPLVRVEVRERPFIEPAFRALPREPLFPIRFAFVWAIYRLLEIEFPPMIRCYPKVQPS